MDEQVRPDEAARALAEIGQAQEQVIKLAVIPTWFWWAIAVLMLGFSAAVESKRDLAIGIGTAVFVLGVISSTGFVVFGTFRRAQVRNDLLGPTGVAAILAFVALTVGVSLAVAFGAQALDFAWPGTLGTGVAAVLMVTGGPVLMRYLHGVMLANRTGSPR